jgi:hypothetical protein
MTALADDKTAAEHAAWRKYPTEVLTAWSHTAGMI